VINIVPITKLQISWLDLARSQKTISDSFSFSHLLNIRCWTPNELFLALRIFKVLKIGIPKPNPRYEYIFRQEYEGLI